MPKFATEEEKLAYNAKLEEEKAAEEEKKKLEEEEAVPDFFFHGYLIYCSKNFVQVFIQTFILGITVVEKR